MKTIVVGYDGTEPAQRALERAAELAEAFKSKVIVTSVARVLATPGRATGGVDPTDPPEAPTEELAQARSFLQQRGITAEYQPAVGDPADAISEVAERENADLIVVGTRELNMIQRLLGQSVSEAVVRHTDCDVLIVHSNGDG